MSQETLYTIRDPSGAVYGPANMALLRQWVGEGRITPQMELAPQGAGNFVPAGQIPELADVFAPAAAMPTSVVGGPPSLPQNYTVDYPGAQRAVVYPYQATHGLAVASLVCSLLAWVFCGIPAVLGIIFGHVARAAIRREPERYSGDGMALAGLVIGYIFLCFYVLFIIAYVIVIMVAVSSGGRP